MSTLNIQLLCRKSKKKSLNYRHLLPGTIINPQRLEPPMSRTIFYGPKDIRAIEVRLYLIQIVEINSHTYWQTVEIQISWLLQKPADLDLQYL